MDAILVRLAELQLQTVAFQMENIRVRNKGKEQMDIKDIADLLKYSETLKNLKAYKDSFYNW